MNPDVWCYQRIGHGRISGDVHDSPGAVEVLHSVTLRSALAVYDHICDFFDIWEWMPNVSTAVAEYSRANTVFRPFSHIAHVGTAVPLMRYDYGPSTAWFPGSD